MATANYTAGSWVGILRSRTAVFLDPATPPALIESIWDLLADAPEAHEVLHAVTSSFGVSLAQIPSFGIVDFRGALRVFLRGDLDLTVQLPGGPVELNGRDVTTWAERRLDLPEWYRLTAVDDSRPGAVLPLTEGVVMLQSLTVAVSAAAAGPVAPVVPHAVVPVPAAGGQPASEPVPEPVNGQDPATEHEVSAETVMGLLDEDPQDAGELPEPGPATEADSAPDTWHASAAHQVPAHELTGSYDHLWEKTVIRRIEDAAVRDDPEDDEADDEPEAGEPGTDERPDAALPDAPVRNPAPPAPDLAGAPPVLETPVPPVPENPVPPATPAPGAGGGLIDSVPWRTGGSNAPVSPQFNPANVPVPAREPAADPAVESALETAGFDGDHDGHTIMKSDFAGLGAHPAPGPEATADAGTGPLVLALVCGHGHANPPTRAQCAACGSPLPSDAVQVARPRLGRMRVSSGELVDLDQSLVIGRQPSVSRVQGGVMPRLVQVSSPSGDISRSHVEVRLEGWHVMLCDLKATNGTVLVREGQQPRRLAQNEMAILLDGDIAELGDDISLRFEEIL